MSASLVGSEMCIRDSAKTARRRGAEPEDATNATNPDRRQRRAGELRKETVSYTHLTLPTICSV
eukprot:2303534-Alexandrium_andersonii.AAC.1